MGVEHLSPSIRTQTQDFSLKRESKEPTTLAMVFLPKRIELAKSWVVISWQIFHYFSERSRKSSANKRDQEGHWSSHKFSCCFTSKKKSAHSQGQMSERTGRIIHWSEYTSLILLRLVSTTSKSIPSHITCVYANLHLVVFLCYYLLYLVATLVGVERKKRVLLLYKQIMFKQCGEYEPDWLSVLLPVGYFRLQLFTLTPA